MASVTLTGWSYNYVNARCELSNPFTSDYYVRIVVSTGTTKDGSQNPPDGIIWEQWADETTWWEEFPDDGSGSVIYVDIENPNVAPNTEYTFYYYAETASRQYCKIDGFWFHSPYAPLEIVSILGIDNGDCILTAENPDDVDFADDTGEGSWELHSYDNINGDSEYHLPLIDKEENSDGTYTYYFRLSGKYTCANYYDVCFWFDTYCENAESGTYNNILSETSTFKPYPNSYLLYSEFALTIVKYDDNNIKMTIKNQSRYLWDEYIFLLYRAIDDEDVLTDTITATAVGEYSFSGLEEGSYKVVAKAFYNGRECYAMNNDRKTFDIYERTQTFTITASRPGYFYWTTAEKNAFNGKGATTILTAARWNAFVDNINEILRYKGLTSATLNSELYGVVQGTYMNDFIKQAKGVSGNDFTANQFNIVRHSIGTMKSTGISTKYSGDEVIGSEFITLQDKLNEVT